MFKIKEEKTEDFLKKNIKIAFSKVKDHISSLEKEINALKEVISDQNKEIKVLFEKIDKWESNKDLNQDKKTLEKSSTGNQGVYSRTHALTHYTLNDQLTNINQFSSDMKKVIASLPKQELLVFLTLYQLEEDYGRDITYLDIARTLKLSESCIRHYTSNLIKKGLPILKIKNNRAVFLRIKREFRDLNLKNELVNLYYQSDPEQKRLSDKFNPHF